MSFNIFNILPPEEEILYFSDIWANRADFNLATIKRYAPDIIAFQELCPEQWQTYREPFAEFQHFGAETNLGTAILWKASRFEKIAEGFFYLGDNPHEHKMDWGADGARSAGWVKLRELTSSTEFLVLNTHFDDESELSRIKSAPLILEQLTQLNPNNDLPIIMCGDFNCNPWSPVYQTFLADNFVDTYRAAGNADSADSNTFHGFHGRDYFALEWGNQIFWRVDWILARNGKQRLQTTSCTIVRDAAPPVFASDHYPVVTELMFME